MTHERTDALTTLRECAEFRPEIRLGQMMMFIDVLARADGHRSLWDVEDDELLALLRKHRTDLAASAEPLAAVA
jgi:hypothetical protein